MMNNIYLLYEEYKVKTYDFPLELAFFVILLGIIAIFIISVKRK